MSSRKTGSVVYSNTMPGGYSEGPGSQGSLELATTHQIDKLQLEVQFLQKLIYGLGGLGLMAFAWIGTTLFSLSGDTKTVKAEVVEVRRSIDELRADLRRLDGYLRDVRPNVERSPSPPPSVRPE